MSLIENLDRPSWREFLAGTFATTLNVLEQDRYRLVGSSVDDLRAWLCAGGLRTRGRDSMIRRASAGSPTSIGRRSSPCSTISPVKTYLE